MPKAVFLDRDGTIIEDGGHLSTPSQAVFIPGAFDALKRLQEEFVLFIVTNQSGIAKGEITEEDAERVNGYVVGRLAEAGVHIRDVFVCPHLREDGCPCIKPKPHFLHRAAEQYQIDLPASFTVGDHPHDVEFARNVGGRGVYVLTGHGPNHRNELLPDVVIKPDICAAAEYILKVSADHG